MPEGVLAQIAGCDWDAAKHLARTANSADFFSGDDSLFVAMDGDSLCAFVTLAGRGFLADCGLTPWAYIPRPSRKAAA